MHADTGAGRCGCFLALHFVTYPGSRRPILPATPERARVADVGLTLDAARLWSYGIIHRHLVNPIGTVQARHGAVAILPRIEANRLPVVIAEGDGGVEGCIGHPCRIAGPG